MSKLTIFYHSENVSDASRIIGDLKQYDLDVFSLTELDFKYNFLSIVESVQTPVLILLSQNWLKTGATLYNSLPVLEDLKKEQRLFVVCIDGVAFENGSPVRSETKIETVVDAMPYLKYWQETYLRVRGNRQQLDNAINQEQELVAKVTSGEIGNIINFYRDLNPTKFESLIGSNYQPFFDHFGFAAKKVEKTVTPVGDTHEHRVEGEEAPTQEAPQEDVVIQELGSDYDEAGLGVLVDDIDAEADFYNQVGGDTNIEEVAPDKEGVIEKSFAESVIESMVESVVSPFVRPAVIQDPEWFESEENPAISEPSLEELAEIPSLSVDNVLEKAAQYFEENKDDLGFNLFENAIESTHSNNTTLRYYYAYYLAQRKSAFEEAIHQLDTILLYDSKNDNAYFLLAELAEIKANFALAKNYYLETLKLNPEYPHINYRIGVILQEHFKGAADEAANYFKAELAKDENNIDAQYRLGIYSNEVLEDSLEAEKYFLKVLNDDPEHGFANYDLALIYHKKGDPLKAAFYYEEGCKNNPELKTEQNDIAFLSYLKEEKEEPKIQTQSQPEFSQNLGHEKTILITGATSGIGLATAEQFAKAGNCKLILAGRRVKRLAQITEAIKDNYDIPTTYLQFDIQDVVAVKEAIASLIAPFQTVDVLINNAGLALGLSDIVDGNISDWETMIDTNVKGLLYATKEVAPLMIAQNSGHIINIGSIAGREAYPNGNVYNATKAAVDILTKAMRLDLHKYNIRVGQVAPGHVETEFAINRFHGDEQKANIYQDFTPLSPIDIANIIFFMVTQPAHVNIQDVLVFPTQQASATVINRSGRLKS